MICIKVKHPLQVIVFLCACEGERERIQAHEGILLLHTTVPWLHFQKGYSMVTHHAVAYNSALWCAVQQPRVYEKGETR